MSFDLFVGCFNNGEKSLFSRSLIDQEFAPYVTHREQNCLTLDFGNNDCCYLYRDDAEFIDAFNINHPISAPRLYEALLAVLRSENLVLYMPGENPPLIGCAETEHQLPHAMIKALGSPVLLTSADEIEAWISKA